MIFPTAFALGRLVATQTVLDRVPTIEIESALSRHSGGDWGSVDSEDLAENNNAVETDQRILSDYLSLNGIRFWIITEADRSTTTILLPEDY